MFNNLPAVCGDAIFVSLIQYPFTQLGFIPLQSAHVRVIFVHVQPEGNKANGFTATGVTVSICVGFWQLVSLHVRLSQGRELLGIIGFVAFYSSYAAGGDKLGFIKSLAVNYSGIVRAFFAALATDWLAPVSGLSALQTSVITTIPFSAVVVWQGRFWLLPFTPGGFLGMTLFFAGGMNWTVTLLGFLAGNCVGIIPECGGQKLSEATTKSGGY